jgi:hypothetical protein
LTLAGSFGGSDGVPHGLLFWGRFSISFFSAISPRHDKYHVLLFVLFVLIFRVDEYFSIRPFLILSSSLPFS